MNPRVESFNTFLNHQSDQSTSLFIIDCRQSWLVETLHSNLSLFLLVLFKWLCCHINQWYNPIWSLFHHFLWEYVYSTTLNSRKKKKVEKDTTFFCCHKNIWDLICLCSKLITLLCEFNHHKNIGWWRRKVIEKEKVIKFIHRNNPLNTENQSLKKKKKALKSMTGLQKHLKKESNNKNKPKKKKWLFPSRRYCISFIFFFFFLCKRKWIIETCIKQT